MAVNDKLLLGSMATALGSSYLLKTAQEGTVNPSLDRLVYLIAEGIDRIVPRANLSGSEMYTGIAIAGVAAGAYYGGKALGLWGYDTPKAEEPRP